MYSELTCGLIVFILVFVLQNQCEGKLSSRKAKLLTFNTEEDDTLAVNLEFSIPFVKIPIKKTMDTFGPTDVSLPTINVNLAGLAIGGVVVVATVIGIPLFMKTFAALHPEQRYSRVLDHTEFGADQLFNLANQLMLDSRSLHGCVMRVACWSAQTTEHHGMDILNNISSNQILSSVVNVTAVTDALRAGRQGADCLQYGPCALKQHLVPALLRGISSFTSQKGSRFH